ncbi:MAG: tRNA (adenosine(37)-N6)-threonylcarbamoyltransferase complex ATPase subunit type 1 TsaE [Acidimicrobiia bacterium]
MTVYRTQSVDQTRQFARALAGLAVRGDLVLLAGEMGAGKTAFAQGFGAGLGVIEPITSPTFTLIRRYEGRLPVYHVDVYRLDRLAEVSDLGLNELIEEGVTLIEWGDVVTPVLPADFLEVRITYGTTDEERQFELRFVGGSWSARHRVLRETLVPWSL